MVVSLSTIIVNWNTRELLAHCLHALECLPVDLRSDVIVVDNASTDGSAEMVGRRFPWVQLIPCDRNLGFGAANNLALRQARGRYVLLLNPDTEVRPGAIETLARFLDDHPQTGVVGTMLLNPDGTLQPSCHDYYSFTNSLLHNRLVERLTDRWKVAPAQQSGQPTEVDWMTGACLLARRSVLSAVGGFDLDYFLYAEEIDLQFRVRELGWSIVYVPSPGVVHYGGQSARQAPLAATFHDYRGRWLFVRKHQSAWLAGAYLAKTVFALGCWLTYWAARQAINPGAENRRQRQAYWQLLTWHLRDRGLVSVPQLSLGAEQLRGMS